MKKHISILIMLICLSVVGTAQSYRDGSLIRLNAAGTALATDTLIDTDTGYLWTNRTDHNQWANASMQFAVTQVTGTTTCTIIVQGSNNATNAVNGTWTTLANYTTGSVGLVDTGTTKNTTYVFNFPDCQYKRIRVRAITGGTQRSVFSGTYYLAAKFVGLTN